MVVSINEEIHNIVPEMMDSIEMTTVDEEGGIWLGLEKQQVKELVNELQASINLGKEYSD